LNGSRSLDVLIFIDLGGLRGAGENLGMELCIAAGRTSQPRSRNRK
jgi:hypothetical protein